MCKTVTDRGEKHKANLSLILPIKLKESRKYLWTNSQVTEWTTNPGLSGHSPMWAHVQRNTASFISTPFPPSHCTTWRPWSKELSEQRQDIQLKFFLRLHRSDGLQQVLLPPGDRKWQVSGSLEVQTRVLDTLTPILLRKSFSCFTI